MKKKVKAKNKSSYSSNSLVFSRRDGRNKKDPKLKKVAAVGSDKFAFELHQKKRRKKLPTRIVTHQNQRQLLG